MRLSESLTDFTIYFALIIVVCFQQILQTIFLRISFSGLIQTILLYFSLNMKTDFVCKINKLSAIIQIL